MEQLDPMKILSDTGFAQNNSLIVAADLDKIKLAMIKFARAYTSSFLYHKTLEDLIEADLLEFEMDQLRGLEPKDENLNS